MPFLSDHMLLLSILAPLLAGVAVALAPKGATKPLALAGFGLPLLLALHAWRYFPEGLGGGYAFLHTYDTGLTGIGLSLKLGLNGLALPLFVLAGIVGLAAGLYALQSGAERLKTYLALLLVMHAGLMGVFASVDVFFFYFFHELALIPTFIMVGLWGGRDRHYAAMKMTIYLTLGAMLSLIGLIAIYVQSGAQSFDLIALREALATKPLDGAAQGRIFGLLLFGLGTLVSLWPLHTWAPLGYGAAPSSAAMLHAGVLKKFGLYGLLQIAVPLLPTGAAAWAWPLAWLAVAGNVLVIGFVTIAQRDLKQMIGFSSVMHMGYAFLGIACLAAGGGAAAAGGVVLLMVAHGLSVALLFLLSTSIWHRTRSFDLEAMGGLAQRAPVLAVFFVAATFASIGLPGFANFWGELVIFVVAWKFSPLLTALAVAGVVISAIYGLRAATKILFGSPTEAFTATSAEHPPADLRWAEKIPALLLLAALLGLGFWPRALAEPLNSALTALYPISASAASTATPTPMPPARP
jgi:NADH-quinone oxidoreductase subunit M